jgi:hypothetical protein
VVGKKGAAYRRKLNLHSPRCVMANLSTVAPYTIIQLHIRATGQVANRVFHDTGKVRVLQRGRWWIYIQRFYSSLWLFSTTSGGLCPRKTNVVTWMQDKRYININGTEYSGVKALWFKQHSSSLNPRYWGLLMSLFPDVVRRPFPDMLHNNNYTMYCWKRNHPGTPEYIEVVWTIKDDFKPQ